MSLFKLFSPRLILALGFAQNLHSSGIKVFPILFQPVCALTCRNVEYRQPLGGNQHRLCPDKCTFFWERSLLCTYKLIRALLSAYDLDLTRSSQLLHEPLSLTKELDIVNGFWGRASFYVGVAPARLSMFQRWFLY